MGTKKTDATDGELLDAWRGGSRVAGDELFDRCYPRLYAFFANLASANRQDLVQRTMLACVEGRDRVRDGAAFRGYLLTIAKRMLYQSIRERLRDEQFDPAVSKLHDIDPTPSQLVMQAHQLQLTVEHLRRIPIDQQIALELFYLQGIRGPELAGVLEVAEGTVRSRLTRGIDNLRESIDAAGGYVKRSVTAAEIEDALDELGRLLGVRRPGTEDSGA